jgi:hypothetical protein
MKQGSAFPYISYAVVRRARIGFSVMNHCICHERGTRFNAVPGWTPKTDETTFSKIGGGAIVSRNNADCWNRVNSVIVRVIKLDLKPPTVDFLCLSSPLRVP